MRFAVRAIGAVGMALALSGCFVPLATYWEATNPDTRPWWCDSQPSQHGGHDPHPVYDDVEKGMLSWDDCHEVSANLQKAMLWALQWPTLADAEADGFDRIVPYAEGMGTHHTRGAISQDFTPTRPQFLQYGGNGPDAPLVGMSWYVNNGPAAPPAGFVGDNDWWHTHEYLCFQGGIVVYDGRCEDAGIPGTSIYLGNNWMLHAWIVPGWQNNPDVFVNHHPCLLADGMAGPHDACWDMAGGGHGGHGT